MRCELFLNVHDDPYRANCSIAHSDNPFSYWETRAFPREVTAATKTECLCEMRERKFTFFCVCQHICKSSLNFAKWILKQRWNRALSVCYKRWEQFLSSELSAVEFCNARKESLANYVLINLHSAREAARNWHSPITILINSQQSRVAISSGSQFLRVSAERKKKFIVLQTAHNSSWFRGDSFRVSKIKKFVTYIAASVYHHQQGGGGKKNRVIRFMYISAGGMFA